MAACSGAPQQNRLVLRLLVISTAFENSPIYFTKIPLIGQVAPKEAQVNSVIAFSWLKSISQWLLTVLKSTHWHDHYGLFIPWMDFSLRRYEEKLSLVNLRVHFEPPIASQKVTKFPYLPIYLLTTWLQYGSGLSLAIKSDTYNVLKEGIAISFSAKGIEGKMTLYNLCFVTEDEITWWRRGLECETKLIYLPCILNWLEWNL